MMEVDDYFFKCSPESSGDDSFTGDYLDNPSDEDFLQQLSSDLDIPLLLNGGEEELSLLNSFFDKSPEEILSDMTPPLLESKFTIDRNELDTLHKLDLTQYGPEAFPNIKSEIKLEDGDIYIDESSFSSSRDSNSPISSNSSEESRSPLQTLNIKLQNNRINSSNTYNLSGKKQPKVHTSNNNVIYKHEPLKGIKDNIRILKLPTKEAVTSNNQVDVNMMDINKSVVIGSTSSTNHLIDSTNTTRILNNSQKVVILDNVPVNSVNNIKTVPTYPKMTTISNPVTFSTISTVPTCVPIFPISSIQKKQDLLMNVVPARGQMIDARAFKRQQRMIKNRESACLSRKKKRDYVTSLEVKIQQLSEENERLQVENSRLKEELTHKNKLSLLNIPTKTITKTLAVCALFCVMSLNINFLQSPLNDKNSGFSQLRPEDYPKQEHHGRGLLWVHEMDDSLSLNENKTSESNFLPMCPMYVNQSENVRLAKELHRLIGRPYNATKELYKNNHFSKNDLHKKERRMKIRNYSVTNSFPSTSLDKMNKKNKKITYSSMNSELQIFTAPDNLYAEFFEAINKQDDTFYLVSLSPDHLLLPALNHNKTTRPKMSLLLPSMLTNGSVQPSTVSLMQIDCEVLDTRLLHLQYGVIPRHLRSHNSTRQSYSGTSNDDVTNAKTTYGKNYTVHESYKPYFMRKKYLKLKGSNEIYSTINRDNKDSDDDDDDLASQGWEY